MKEIPLDDCEYYYRGKCKKLNELICEEKECSFYKPKKKGEKNGRSKR